MLILKRTDAFQRWQLGLRDPIAQASVASRLSRLSMGHMGDCKALGDGLMELRIHAGPGYRIYFTRHGDNIVLLLCAGDKSEQTADIRKARELIWRYRYEN